MRKTLLALLFGTTLAGVGLACSNDEPTFEEYYRQFQAIEQEMEADSIEIVRLSIPASPDAEIRAALAEIVRPAADDFASLDPVPSLEPAHNAMVQAVFELAYAIEAGDELIWTAAARRQQDVRCELLTLAESEGLLDDASQKGC